MIKSISIGILLCFSIFLKGISQTSAASSIPNYTYHPRSADKQSWQQLNLFLSSLHFTTVTSGVSTDSSLLYASRLSGLSRTLVVADAIDDPELLTRSNWFDERQPGKGVSALSKVTGKKYLELLILLGAYYSFQPNIKCCGFKDSAEYYLKNAINESKKINEKKAGRAAGCLLAKLYFQADDPNNDNHFNKLINECRAEGDKQTEAKIFAYKGVYTRIKNTPPDFSIVDFLEKRFSYLEKAREIYEQLKDTEGEINMLANAAVLKMAISRFDDAYNMLIKAHQLENSIGYPYTHYTADLIAMITEAQGKFGEPLKYTLEAVKVSEQTHDSIGLADFYTRLGLLYYTEGGRNEESLKWMLKAQDQYISANNANLYMNLINIVSIMNELDQPKEALDLLINVSKKVPPADSNDVVFHNIAFATGYIGTKQYELAERYTLAADSIQRLAEFVSVNSDFERTMILPLFGDIYFGKGQFAKAKKFYDQYLTDSSRIPALGPDLVVYKKLIGLDSIFHDAPAAVAHYKIYTQLLDSNFRTSKIRQAEELQVLYQTEEQKNQISALNQKATLEQANLKQAKLVRNLTIAGIFAVLIIAGLLYRQSWLRKRNNEVITHKNELLEHFLTEKEWLLKEIHHRVKNNLQIVMSLLNSQSAYIDNEPALTAIHDSQHRVHAMSLIHQKLYNTENVSTINMLSYIKELASYLSDSFDTGQRVRFQFDIIPLELDVSQAVPLGLILNEAITNAIKYAFPGNRDGIINISLSNTNANQYLLCISDDGIGMPANFKGNKKGSLGMSLMAGLSEDLEGKFSIDGNNGTTVKISFLQEQANKQPDILASSFIKTNQPLTSE